MGTPSEPDPSRRARWAVAALVLVIFAVVVVRCAWVSDDAFITLRTVHNALNGHGLRWNVAERVQSYTHPLWMLLLLGAHALTREPYYGTLALGTLCSLGAVGLLLGRVARTPYSALAAGVPLIWSKAFVDFSTSGLENPLTHLLLAALLISLLVGGERPRDVFRTALIATLALLNRLDLLLMFAPGVLAHLWMARRAGWRALGGALAAAAVPLVAWEAASFVYYGSLLPNTAYAKLATGIPRSEMVGQGLRYLGHALWHDPLTPAVIACGVIPAWKVRSPPVLALLGGAALYVAYTVWVGGDFMAGRFLTAPFFAAALACSRLELGPRSGVALALVAAVLGAASGHAPPYSGSDYTRIPAEHGIVDERGYYHRGAGLLASKRPISHAFAREGRRARKKGPHTVFRAAVGYFGYYAGPAVHVVDRLGLNEPLLARIPARYNPDWRVGHYRRLTPHGYDPRQDLPPRDPDLAALYTRVKRITRGPLLDPERLADALRLQVFGAGLDPWRYRFPDILQVDEDRFSGVVARRGVSVHVTPPRVIHPVLTGPPGQHVRLLVASEHRVFDTLDVVTDGTAQSLGSPGHAELVLVFPRDPSASLQLESLELGP